MKKFRVLSLLLIAVLLLAALSACGDKNENTDRDESHSPEEIAEAWVKATTSGDKLTAFSLYCYDARAEWEKQASGEYGSEQAFFETMQRQLGQDINSFNDFYKANKKATKTLYKSNYGNYKTTIEMQSKTALTDNELEQLLSNLRNNEFVDSKKLDDVTRGYVIAVDFQLNGEDGIHSATYDVYVVRCNQEWRVAAVSSSDMDKDPLKPTTTTTTKPTVAIKEYTVFVKTAGGMILPDVEVYIYADSTLRNITGYSKTDANGVAKFTLPESREYAIVLRDTPKGYDVKNFYTFDGTGAVVTLTSSPITGKDLSSVSLKLGDVMYDFTVTTPDGEKITLSEMLKTKKMVLINFWYTSCSWCVTEFPYMEQAYQQYKDDVGIVALDPLGETDAAIKAFPTNYNLDLTFPLAGCPTAWTQTFGITGYPTSVIVDRYGVITLIEAGAITSVKPFTSLFAAMTADDYQQKLYNSVSDLIVNPKPTYQMDSPENIAGILNSGDINVSYHAEETPANKEYAWPFIKTVKDGVTCLKASNQGVDGSFGVIYADVTLKKGQALGLDYWVSCENESDTFVIVTNGETVLEASGDNKKEGWKSYYPVVADKDGAYEVALFYLKNDSNAVGDDTVYIKNVRVVDSSKIDTPTSLPRSAAKHLSDDSYEYVQLVYNSGDGYYHVGSKDGPVLMADLMNYTEFNEGASVWEMVYDNKIVVNGVSYTEELTTYCNTAVNTKDGLVKVDQKLMELLQKVDQAIGFDDVDNKEWMKLCKYFETYGNN